MKVICSYCTAVMQAGSGPISHGCCSECWPKVRAAAGLVPKPYPVQVAA